VQRFRIAAIVGVIVFGLASIALAIVGLLTAIADSGMGCPGCSHSGEGGSNANFYFLGSGLCVVATVVGGFAMRRSAPSSAPGVRPKSNKLGLRP
jgi:hypothetical protein